MVILIIDLCSGSSDPSLQIQNQLKIKYNFSISVKLTDKFPNIKSFQRTQKLSNGSIDFCVEPIDATNVSSNLKGFRTLFTSFHHFKPDNAKKILQDAVSQKVAIGIFEMTERNPCRIFMGLLIPSHVLLMTPFVRPFKWSRFFLTYCIPMAPFISLWDGIVSHLRTYSLEELDTLISEINSIGYVGKRGKSSQKGLG